MKVLYTVSKRRLQQWPRIQAAAAATAADTAVREGSRRVRQARCCRRCVAGVHADVSREGLFEYLCEQYGILSAAAVSPGPWGLGLFQRLSSSAEFPNTPCRVPRSVADRASTHQLKQLHGSQQHKQLLVSVPLHLVLSCSIPGCSPKPQDVGPDLHKVLYQSCCTETWELQVAVLLLWAIKQPADTAVGGFWRAYAAAFLPAIRQQHSLLLWSDQELAELLDPQLVATALAWQQQVKQAYYSVVQPSFERMYAVLPGRTSIISSSNHGANNSSRLTAAALAADTSVPIYQVEGACSLQQWFWAVATVESRAFAISKVLHQRNSLPSTSCQDQVQPNSSSTGLPAPSGVAGAEPAEGAAEGLSPAPGLVGLAPVLDLANHTCCTNCHHSVDQQSNTFNLHQTLSTEPCLKEGSNNSSRIGDECDDSSAALGLAVGAEILICYGEKDNRQLMEQYGFCVPDNPFDRVGLPEQHSQRLWLSHKAVKQAARLLKQRLLQQEQQPRNSSSMAAVRTPTVARVPIQAADSPDMQPTQSGPSALYTAAQVDAAVASVITAAGWRNLREYMQVNANRTTSIMCSPITVSSARAA